MLRDVKHTVTDGLLGFATATGDGKSLKIGVSPIVSDTPIIITGDMDATKIKDRLGLSPLADAVMDSVQFGASRIYCLPVSATTAGELGIVSKTGDGGGSVTVDGSPTNAFSVVVKFTAQGQLNTAAFVYRRWRSVGTWPHSRRWYLCGGDSPARRTDTASCAHAARCSKGFRDSA